MMELMDAGRVPGLKVTMMTVFVLITQLPLAASDRNRSLTFNDTLEGFSSSFYVWDSILKTDGKCRSFHSKEDSSHFFLWPEDQFRYCCSDNEKRLNSSNVNASQYRLKDFVYHQHSTHFLTSTYYDLGLVDQCMPYWKCWNSEAVNAERTDYFFVYKIDCEFNDLKRLYTHRFWSLAFAKYGILMCALPLIALLEVGVLFTTVALGILRPYCGFVKSSWKEIFTLWWRTTKWVMLRTWLHLTVLTVVGNCFMEAIGHQDPYTWETMIINSFGKVYLLLPIVVSIAAFVQQVVDWRVVEKCIRKTKEQHEEQQRPQGTYSSSVGWKYPEPQAYVEESQLQSEFMDDDWRWQPIFVQISTLSLLGFYIMYSSDYMREAFVSLLLAVAATAASWSALVAVILFFRKMNILSKSFRPDFLVVIPPEEQASTLKSDPEIASEHHLLDDKV